MAEKVLSQAEVDTLLKGVASGEVDTNAAATSADGVRSYDLTSPEHVIRGQTPGLEVVNERFTRLFQSSLSVMLRRTIVCSTASTQTMKFGEFMKKIPLPSSINLVKFEPLRGHALIVIDATTVYLLIDHFFGGTGQTQVKTEGREFTPIQKRFISKVFDVMLVDLQKAWTPVHSVRMVYARSEINPQFAMVVVPTEVVLTIAFRLEIEGNGNGASHEIFLCLPYPMIEPIRDKLYSGFQNDQPDVDRQWTARFRSQIQQCSTKVTAELGAAALSVNEVSRLSVGDVIVLDTGVNDDLDLKVEGRPKFYGKPGIHRGKPAFQVNGVIRFPEEAGYGE